MFGLLGSAPVDLTLPGVYKIRFAHKIPPGGIAILESSISNIFLAQENLIRDFQQYSFAYYHHDQCMNYDFLSPPPPEGVLPFPL